MSTRNFSTRTVAMLWDATCLCICLALIPCTSFAAPNHPCEPWPGCKDGGSTTLEELEARVTTLEGDVETLQVDMTTVQGDVTETKDDVADLSGRVDSLESRVDALEQAANELAVYDANDNKVGKVISVEFNGFNRPWVYLQIQGYAFALRAERDRLAGTDAGEETALFVTTDCTGQAYVRALDDRMIMPRATVTLPGQTVYLQEPGADSQTLTLHSQLNVGVGGCGAVSVEALMFPATPVVDLNSLFIPPFSVR